ncbi:MAG TPA: hypothetical protein VJ725_21450 [Thermoanaerobaculia bacterium]|nr:hypothetical protein [Thermoanaerobaculia bacterium]
MDPRICCALGVCCPPGSAEQEEALIALLREGIDEDVDLVTDYSMRVIARAVFKLFGAGPHEARFKELESGS